MALPKNHLKNKYKSVNITRFYMKIVGFWRADSKFEQRMMDFALRFAIASTLYSAAVILVDLWHCLHDIYEATENLCASLLLVLILVKLGNFTYHRDVLLDIISHAETHFWELDYDEYGNSVLEEYDRRAVMFTFSFSIIVQVGALIYITAPILENPHFEQEKRTLPFRFYIDLPLTETPLYEIVYTIQSIATLHVGISTFCFDNFLCCFCTHVAGQFKVLAHKFEVVIDKYVDTLKTHESSSDLATESRRLFNCCIREHLQLIDYVDKLERCFGLILLGQLLVSSITICIGGFQFLAVADLRKRILFFLHSFGGVVQLFLYTFACQDVTQQSDNLEICVYNMPWYELFNDKFGKMIKHGVLMVMNRTQQPCVLTAGKFAVMSLQTFRSILGTAASYFTLLRQMAEDDV